MKTTQHTLGPWRVATQGLGRNNAVFPAEAVAPCIADCDGNPNAEEAQANARLIAAAPTMLDALERIYDWTLAPGSKPDPQVVAQIALDALRSVKLTHKPA